MLSNLLRIVLSRLLFHKVMDERNKIEQEINRKEQAVAQRRITANMSLEEQKEIVKARMQQRERFCMQPLMAKTYEINMMMLCSIMRIFVIITTVVSVCILFYFYDGEMGNYEMVGLVTICFMWGLLGLIKYCYCYMKNTKYVFYQNRISICRLWKKEKVITYDELKEEIKRKKIKVHNGRFEFPYKTGYIPVYTWGDKVPSVDFYRFINEQCGINLPDMKERENDIVHKSGMAWVMRNYLAMPIFGIAVFGGVLGAVDVYEIENGLKKMIQFFFQYFFSTANMFGIMGLGCIVIGIIWAFPHYLSAKKRFKDCEDIKVSLF